MKPLLVALTMLWTSTCLAGATTEPVLVVSFQQSPNGHFSLEIKPLTPSKQSQQYSIFGTCNVFRIEGHFANREIPFMERLFGGDRQEHPSKNDHQTAVVFLSRAARDQKPIELGVMGSFFKKETNTYACLAKSRAFALVSLGKTDAVISYREDL